MVHEPYVSVLPHFESALLLTEMLILCVIAISHEHGEGAHTSANLKPNVAVSPTEPSLVGYVRRLPGRRELHRNAALSNAGRAELRRALVSDARTMPVGQSRAQGRPLGGRNYECIASSGGRRTPAPT